MQIRSGDEQSAQSPFSPQGVLSPNLCMLTGAATDRARFIVQTAPEFRVVLMDATIDPEEGGNG